MSHDWTEPEGGTHHVALNSRTYEARRDQIENFLGRRLSKYSHYVSHGGQTYAVFRFREKEDADRFMTAFDGEPFDPRDKGRGVHWSRWYKGRVAKRKKDPYDFRED